MTLYTMLELGLEHTNVRKESESVSFSSKRLLHVIDTKAPWYSRTDFRSLEFISTVLRTFRPMCYLPRCRSAP